MYGMIGKMVAVQGKRRELLDLLLETVGDMPGCLSYVIHEDPADENAIWITEAWKDEASHKASPQMPAVRAVIARARPLIASFGDHVITRPVGGHGLGTAR